MYRTLHCHKSAADNRIRRSATAQPNSSPKIEIQATVLGINFPVTLGKLLKIVTRAAAADPGIKTCARPGRSVSMEST